VIVRKERLRQLRAVVKRKRPPKRMPKMLHPMPIERKYRAYLLGYVRSMRSSAEKILLPALPTLVAEANRDKPHSDAWPDDLDMLMSRLSVSIDQANPESNVKAIAVDIGQKTSEWNDKQWQKTIRAVTGTNTLQYEPWLNTQLKSFQSENMALIKSIKDQSMSQLHGDIQRGLKGGLRHEEIAEGILERYDVTESRASLIARDQVSKLNGQLTELRQLDIGIDEYRWNTSMDERVRPSHAEHEGKIFKWSEPPEETGHPGEDYQCRCWAEPIMDKFYGQE
jgi:SPP1 gp7 family putative phage head morphogenesis protein